MFAVDFEKRVDQLAREPAETSLVDPRTGVDADVHGSPSAR